MICRKSTDSHSQEVYDKAKENLQAFLKRDVLFKESKDCYYIYRLTMNGRSQAGLVCVSSVDDYENNVIKKHEFTRPEKELDRINHMKTIGAQTGNVFLAYRDVEALNELLNQCMTKNPVYNFVAEDGIEHTIWLISDDKIVRNITQLFAAGSAGYLYCRRAPPRCFCCQSAAGNGQQSHTGIQLFSYHVVSRLRSCTLWITTAW